jgi:Right handed beta helix region
MLPVLFASVAAPSYSGLLAATPRAPRSGADAGGNASGSQTGARGTSVMDVRDFGLTPNDPAAAAGNTARLRALLDPRVSGPAGLLVFPNVTGKDVYHFNGVIPIRDGIHIDLMGSTARYAGAATPGDRNSGLFFALRDFTCENGAIEVACDTTLATGSGHAIQIGARGVDSAHFTVWDALLPVPMGNIQLRNLRISVRNSGANINGSVAIGILGGVQNLVAQNIVIDGKDSLPAAIYYEFGWATDDPDPGRRQTSHAHNMLFSNIIVTRLNRKGSAALGFAGAYGCTIDGLYVASASNALLFYPGESMFYRPWAGVDQAGAKRAILVRNLVAQSLSSTAVVFTGAQTAAHGYLAAAVKRLDRRRQHDAQTELGDFSIDGFAISDAAGWGISTSAGRALIRNGTIERCQRGIVATDDCTKLIVEGVDILDCEQHGMQLDIGLAQWNPPRAKKVGIRDCYIAGNSTAFPTRFPGIQLGDNTDSALVANCRFGYETAYAGVVERTQGHAVLISGAKASNVICSANHVGGLAGSDSCAYCSAASGIAPANGNTIERATGITTSSGNWLTDFASKAPLPLAPGGIISVRGLKSVKVRPSAAITGAILEPGYENGQSLTLINEAAPGHSIHFAAPTTSYVADGTSTALGGMSAARFVWDSGTSLWYRS